MDSDKPGYRNHYVSGCECAEYIDLLELVIDGFMIISETPLWMHGDDVVFCATDKGKQAVGLEGGGA